MHDSEIPQLESDRDEEEEGQFEDKLIWIIITPTKRARISAKNTERDFWTLMMKGITGT